MRQRGKISVFVMLLVFGGLGILRAVDNPRLQQAHGSDIVQLIGAGMCLGAALGLWFGKRSLPVETA